MANDGGMDKMWYTYILEYEKVTICQCGWIEMLCWDAVNSRRADVGRFHLHESAKKNEYK